MPPIEAKIDRLVAAWSPDPLDVGAAETHLRREALPLAVRRRFHADLSDGAKPTLPCRCGQRASRRRRPPKTFETALGPRTIQCAYCRCPPCRRGFFPRARALGTERAGLSPAGVRMTGLAAAETSFARASERLNEVAGVRVSASRQPSRPGNFRIMAYT